MNWPGVAVVTSGCRIAVVAVTSSRPDGQPGCYYTVHDVHGAIVRSGHSLGWSGDGAGSALSAMKNGKAAARRWLKRCASISGRETP